MKPIQTWLNQPDGLAARLRSVRVQSGKAGKDLAEAAGWAPSKVSRIERGNQMPSEADVSTWARLCGADETTSHDLVVMLRAVEAARHDWRKRMQSGQVAVQASYNQLVADSRRIRHFETVYVPGLLQTAGYARRVLTEMVGLHNLDIDDVEAAVAARMQRQQVLYDSSKEFEFLLAEPVLRWLLTEPDVMRSQLDRLQTVIDLPNVMFGIVPMGVHLETTPQNSFQLYDDLAIAETFIGETTHRNDEADAYMRAMDLLWNEAVTGDAARRRIAAAVDSLPRS